MKNIFLLFFIIHLCSFVFAGKGILPVNPLDFNEKKNTKSIFLNSFKISAPFFLIYKTENTPNNIYFFQMLQGYDDSLKRCMCNKARFDARKYHGRKGKYFFAGVFGGFTAISVTAFADYQLSPFEGKRTYSMSENRHLFSDADFLKCYKRNARWQHIKMEITGMMTRNLVGITVMFIMLGII